MGCVNDASTTSDEGSWNAQGIAPIDGRDRRASARIDGPSRIAQALVGDLEELRRTLSDGQAHPTVSGFVLSTAPGWSGKGVWERPDAGQNRARVQSSAESSEWSHGDLLLSWQISR